MDDLATVFSYQKFVLALLVLITLVVGGRATADCRCMWCQATSCATGHATSTPGSEAYTLVGGRWGHHVPGEPLTLTYSYRNLLDGGLRGPDGESLDTDYIRAAVEEAFGVWAAVVPVHFVEVEDDGLPLTGISYGPGQ